MTIDPHASKISPDDPRLKPRISKMRSLRKGPTLIALSLVLVALAVSVVWAVEPRSKRARDERIASEIKTRLPSEILDAPDVVPPAAPIEADAGAPQKSPQSKLYDVPGDTEARSTRATRRSAAANEALRARQAGVVVPWRAPPTIPADDGRGRGAHVERNSERLEQSLQRASQALAELSPDADARQGQSTAGFVQSATDRSDGYLHARIERPRSPYELKAGSIIPAVLITAINSDLPGPVFARVRETVYDSITHEHVVIPQNSTLVAAYDSRIAWGQQRVLLCWQRLIFPNGSSISLECMPGGDLTGAAGLSDEVDEHWGRLAKAAALASLLSAGTAASAGNTTGYYPNLPQQFARGAAAEFGRAGEHVTRREMMVQPTITVRAGWAMNVLVTKDLILEPYHADSAATSSLDAE